MRVQQSTAGTDIGEVSGAVANMPPVTAPVVTSELGALESVAGRVTATSLALPDGLVRGEWLEIGDGFSTMVRGALQWWIGDWMIYGLEHFDLDVDQTAEQTGFDERSLQVMLQVARAFDPERRRETLSFWKHAEVVSLEPATADRLLDECEENGWTFDELRQAIRPRKERAAIEVGTPLDVVRAMQRKIGTVFSSAVVESDGRLLLDDGDGHRWRVSVEPA